MLFGREGNLFDTVSIMFKSETEICKLIMAGLLASIRKAVETRLASMHAFKHPSDFFDAESFYVYEFMKTTVVAIADAAHLNPKGDGSAGLGGSDSKRRRHEVRRADAVQVARATGSRKDESRGATKFAVTRFSKRMIAPGIRYLLCRRTRTKFVMHLPLLGHHWRMWQFVHAIFARPHIQGRHQVVGAGSVGSRAASRPQACLWRSETAAFLPAWFRRSSEATTCFTREYG